MSLDTEKCIGCKLCLGVCPKNVYEFDDLTHKAKLARPERCVNCSACVKQCLGKCLEIKSY
ncbi:MAG: ferredoxin family protein [Candidatus Odinarchaeota archaeon]|nr:ferredoxin family protein [Candidatus Odinarchaeota archaeon]